MQRSKKATHAAVTRFIASLLPLKENDVPRLYHIPRNVRYDPETAVAEQVVLSVTATPGVYSLIEYHRDDSSLDAKTPLPTSPRRLPRTVCFLHRPFDLDRRRVRKGTLVLSSHTSFDEVLTIGFNTFLAERLGMDANTSLCVQGYKGKAGWDAERKIGLVAQVSQYRELLVRRIQHEFGDLEFEQKGLSDDIRVVAIMNAFNEEQVHRVMEMAQQAGWIASNADAGQVLYLTGQPRITGLEAAQNLGMSVACVGHGQAEDWGIRYVADRLRTAFPSIHIKEVYEEEITIVREKKVQAVEEAPASDEVRPKVLQ